jgi:hypothetical protein
MRATPPLVSMDAAGCCAARVAEQLLVLACALPGAHDEGFQRSRELARRFCDGVHAAAATAAIDAQRLVDLSRDLFSAREWSGWYLSFCVVQHRIGGIKAFNCGITSLFRVSHDRLSGPLLAPQTVGRRLRGKGVKDVPSHIAYAGDTMANGSVVAENIEVSELDETQVALIVALADPRVADMLSDITFDDVVSEDALSKAIEDLLNSMNNPERSFLLWWPAQLGA